MEAQNLTTSVSYPLPLNFTIATSVSRGGDDLRGGNEDGSTNNGIPIAVTTGTTTFRLSALQPVPLPFITQGPPPIVVTAALPPPPPIVVTTATPTKIPPPPPIVVTTPTTAQSSSTTTSSSSSGSSTRDLITVLEGTPPMYQCNICNKKFKTKAHIRYHEFCQTGEKPFKCEQCGQGFITKGHYEYHQRTHSGEKAYSCPKCGKGFHQPGQVTRHMRSHNT